MIADLSHKENITPASLFPLGYNYSIQLDKWNISDLACDYVYSKDKVLDFEIPGTLGVILDAEIWKQNTDKERHYPIFKSFDEFTNSSKKAALNLIRMDIDSIFKNLNSFSADNTKSAVFVFETSNPHGMAEIRRMFVEVMMNEYAGRIPVIIKRNYSSLNEQELQLHASTDIGAHFLDGFGDCIWIDTKGSISEKTVNALSFGILQATRTRISKTEYISCPSCGRTLFDLQETTAKIRSRTDHLKGIKIGIMGCIVNGPGEMADADYGYVGTGPGKITLYKGQTVVQRNVSEDKAVDALIDLIRQHGDWVELKVEQY